MEQKIDLREVKSFFDRLADEWDSHGGPEEQATEQLMDLCGIEKDSVVLDVACGTGALIPFYLKRKVKRVDAVDLSPEMIRICREKFSDPAVFCTCGDIMEFDAPADYDVIMIYNAFPHFGEYEALIGKLTSMLKKGGRLCIAHSMSRDALDRHHRNVRPDVSRKLISDQEFRTLLCGSLRIRDFISDGSCFRVVAVKE